MEKIIPGENWMIFFEIGSRMMIIVPCSLTCAGWILFSIFEEVNSFWQVNFHKKKLQAIGKIPDFIEWNILFFLNWLNRKKGMKILVSKVSEVEPGMKFRFFSDQDWMFLQLILWSLLMMAVTLKMARVAAFESWSFKAVFSLDA